MGQVHVSTIHNTERPNAGTLLGLVEMDESISAAIYG
jgi:hypothetical protein